jgi:HemY protein
VKKRLIFWSLALVLVLGALIAVHRQLTLQGDAGYVIIGIGQWALESSLFFMILTLVGAFVFGYFLLGLIAYATRIPKVLEQRSGEQRARRSRQALVKGLLETVEGDWEKAEKSLIRHAADSGIPLINYLTAARAAHFRGASEQRDEYLKLARESTPEAELAVGLTQAELQLANKQFEAALVSLTQLNRVAPSHAAVLRLMHQAYSQMGDWEALRRLFPALHSHKVLMETEIKSLEAETYTALLKQKAKSHDIVALRELWATIPEYIRELGALQALYSAAMIEVGAGAEIEKDLRRAIGKEWNETLLVLYSCIQLPDAERQLQEAETWLGPHPRDAVLYRILAKLAWRCNQWEKTQNYLKRSLDLEPSVEAYQWMGDLLARQNDFAAACTYYRHGLTLASNEVIAQIEQNPLEHAAGEVREEEHSPIVGAKAV